MTRSWDKPFLFRPNTLVGCLVAIMHTFMYMDNIFKHPLVTPFHWESCPFELSNELKRGAEPGADMSISPGELNDCTT